jgi:hypothetical protein
MFPMTDPKIEPIFTRRVQPGCEYSLRPRILTKRPLINEESDVSSTFSLSTKSSFAGLNSSCHMNTSASDIKDDVQQSSRPNKKQNGNGRGRGATRAKAVIQQEADGSTDSEIKKNPSPPPIHYVRALFGW